MAAPSFMAFGTVVATTTTAAPAYPTAPAPTAGNLCLMFVFSNSTAAGTAPAGWTASGLGVVTAGGMSGQVWYRTAVGGETGAQSVTGLTSGTKGAAWIQCIGAAAGGALTPTFTSGTDTATTTTAFAATGGSWTCAIDQLLVAGVISNTTVGTYSANATSPVLTQAGATAPASTSRFAGRTGTNTLYYNSVDAPVTAAGTGAPSYSATMVTTTSATGAGVALFVKVAESTSTAFVKSQPDPVAVTDAAADTIDAVRAQPDPVAASDTASSATDFARIQPDGVGVTDSAVANLVAGGTNYTANLGENIGVVDGGAPQSLDYDETLPESVGVSDAASYVAAVAPNRADPVGVSDSTSSAIDLPRTPADPVGVTDATAVSADSARPMADAAAITDLVTAAADASRSLSDPAAVTDAASGALGAQRAPSDAAGITDAISVVMPRVVTVADFLALTDGTSLDFTGAGVAITDDPEPITDAVSTAQSMPRAPADPVGLTDGAVATLVRAATIADPLALTDAATAATTAGRLVTDALGLTDAVTAELGSLADLPVVRILSFVLRAPTATTELRVITASTQSRTATVTTTMRAANTTGGIT